MIGGQIVEEYIKVCKVFDAMSYQGVYLYDVKQQSIVYASDYDLLRCGLSEEDFRGKGMACWGDLMKEHEMQLFLSAANSIMSGYAYLPQEYRERGVLMFHFNIRHRGRWQMVLHKLSALKFDDKGEPWLLMGLVTPSVASGKAAVYGGVPRTEYIFEYNHKVGDWVQMPNVDLKPTEIEMLRMSMQGYTINQISERMNRSIDSIKTYRREVFEKLGAENISEAISFAVQYCVI